MNARYCSARVVASAARWLNRTALPSRTIPDSTGEWIGPFIGLEAGPALVWDAAGTHFGFGVTPWAGYGWFGYYTYTWVAGSDNLHDLGFYLKSPLLSFGGGGGDPDFDDDD